MRGTLLCARACVGVIGQCHSSDLARRYRCTERTYGRQGKAAWGRAEHLGRTPFGAAGPGSEEGGSDRGTSAICEESARLNEERSHPLWSDPKILLRQRRNAAAERRGCGVRAWIQPTNGAGSNPMPQNYFRITMNI